MSTSTETARDAIEITPDDVGDLTPRPRALFIGGTGNIRVMTWDGSDVTFNSVPVGVLPISVRRVFATGTTAGNIIGLM